MAGIFVSHNRRDRGRNPAPHFIVAIGLVFVLRPGWVCSAAAAPTLLDRPDVTTPRSQIIQVVDHVAEAQRVVLYEEDPTDPQGKRHVGSAIWRSETVTPGGGAPPELMVRADLEVPERGLTMTFSFRRNTDGGLPASHTIELTFNLSADFLFGDIQNVPGILVKPSEHIRGAPLTGLAVKVTSGFFLIGLSAVEVDMQRNLQLLKERAWFDIPIVYSNGRRAILALEKGNPGGRAFDEAFKAWGPIYPRLSTQP